MENSTKQTLIVSTPYSISAGLYLTPPPFCSAAAVANEFIVCNLIINPLHHHLCGIRLKVIEILFL